MAQIARKLPSEAEPRVVNCDLGHSFFIAKDCTLFFSSRGKKTRLFRTCSIREIRAFSPLIRKKFFDNNLTEKKNPAARTGILVKTTIDSTDFRHYRIFTVIFSKLKILKNRISWLIFNFIFKRVFSLSVNPNFLVYF